MSNCIFCSIIAKQAPAHIIFEDDDVIVFLPLHPVADGHLLVVSKQHVESIFDVPPKILKRIALVCQDMSHLLKEKLQAQAVNILNASGVAAQQSVDHLHFHIIPRSDDDDLDLWFHGDQSNSLSLEQIHHKLLDGGS